MLKTSNKISVKIQLISPVFVKLHDLIKLIKYPAESLSANLQNFDRKS